MARVGALPVEGAGGRDANPARDSLRALLLLVLFALTFFAVMLSSLVRGSVGGGRVLPLLSCVGAGVFLSACLLDLLPDVTESFEAAKLEMSFPLPQATIGLGFLMVLCLEQFALLLQERRGYSLHGDHGESASQGEGESVPPPPSALPALLLVASLSLHALFEGLSLAVIPDASKLLQVFAALVIHKTLIGLSLGVRLAGSQLRPLLVAACAFIFSVQVLVGGLAGLSVMRVLEGVSGRVVAASLQGVACGTFLFITTMEALPHELPSSPVSGRPTRLLAVLVGFALIVIFIFAFPEAA